MDYVNIIYHQFHGIYKSESLHLRKISDIKVSCFWGPRQTGKSTLLRAQIKVDKTFNLLQSDVYAKLSYDPSLLRKEITLSDKVIVIDEIQKLPSLMDEVHFLIEELKIKFVLTGSSVSKTEAKSYFSVRRTCAPCDKCFPLFIQNYLILSLAKTLHYGMLPPIHFSKTPELDLRDYVGAYIKEESCR